MDKRATPLASKEQQEELFKLLTEAKNMMRTLRGINEVTKAINKQKAKIVLLAADCQPLEILLHIPDLCEDKGVTFIFVKSKQQLGKIMGVQREVIAACIISGKRTQLDDKIDSIIKKLE